MHLVDLIAVAVDVKLHVPYVYETMEAAEVTQLMPLLKLILELLQTRAVH